MTSLSAPARAPWRPAQVRVVVVAQLIATALVLLAANRSARTGSFEKQTDWVVFGVAGLAAAGVVSAVWLRAAQRRVAIRRARLVRTTDEAFHRVGAAAETDHFAPVAAPSMSHFHRAGCQLVRGKDVRPASVIEHRRAQRTPCAVCRP